MITKKPWLVSSSTVVCDERGFIIANFCPVSVPGLDVDYEDAIDNARLIEVNEAIRSHPVEQIGGVLRGYMANMKRII